MRENKKRTFVNENIRAKQRRQHKEDEQERLQAAVALILQNAEEWPGQIVPRPKIPEFTGHTYSASYFANIDADPKKEGVEGAFKIGRQTVYPKKNLCEWLIRRLKAA